MRSSNDDEHDARPGVGPERALPALSRRRTSTTYGAELAAALDAGACRYLLRGAPPEVLLLAVRALRVLPETGQ